MLTRKSRPALVLALAPLLWFSVPSFAQSGNNANSSPDHGHQQMEHHHHGRWWDNPHLAQKVGLSASQKQQMDQIFEKHRPQLKELNDTLKKDEAAMRPLIEADKLNEHKVFEQIDTIAQARANLEKANARMLFRLRRVLTPDQWKKLKEAAREWREHHPGDHHGPDHMPPPGPPPD